MSKPKVVLYNPRAVFYTMPLAVMAIASALDRDNIDVVIVDGRLENDPVAAVIAAARSAVCVGVTVLTGAPIHDALAVSRAIKSTYPTMPIVWGGWHPSLFPAECLDEAGVTAAVTGQGEDTFRELVARFEDGRSLDGVRGCAHRRAHSTATIEPKEPLWRFDEGCN